MSTGKKSREDDPYPKNPSSFVSMEQCQAMQKPMMDNLERINKALWGEDYRSGMVKDVQVIKSATGTAKAVLLPIFLTLVTALVTAGILGYIHF